MPLARGGLCDARCRKKPGQEKSEAGLTSNGEELDWKDGAREKSAKTREAKKAIRPLTRDKKGLD